MNSGGRGGVAELMEAMAAAGAPLEAILVAVRALETQGRAERERKDKEARRKAEKRAEAKAADAPGIGGGRGGDTHRLVAGHGDRTALRSGESRNPASDAEPVGEAESGSGFRRRTCPPPVRENHAPRPRMRRGRTPDGNAQKEIPPHPHKKNPPPDSKAEALAPRRLAENFAMPADWKDWAREERGWAAAEIESEAANFTDYWLARGAGAAKRDWRRTWQNWVRNARRPDGPHRNASKPGPEDVREAQLRAADLYERIGRGDEAAEIRRHWGRGGEPGAAVTIGETAAGILARRRSNESEIANESGKEQG